MSERGQSKALMELLRWSTLRAQRDEALLARREREIRALQQEERETLAAHRARYGRTRQVRLAPHAPAERSLMHAREEEEAQCDAARSELRVQRLERRRQERNDARRRSAQRVASLQRLIDKQGISLRQAQRRRDDDASDPA